MIPIFNTKLTSRDGSRLATTVAISMVLLCCVMTSAIAALTADLITEGNLAFKQGKYKDAIAKYDSASVDAPESVEVYFNKGDAYYMLGSYNEALDMFKQAAAHTQDLKIEAKSYFNMGNCHIRESERKRDSDLQQSMKSLEKSIGFYQQALTRDSTFSQAAHNLEVARLTLKQMLDEINKQQEKAKEQQAAQQKLVEQLKHLIQRQEKLLEQTLILASKSDVSEPSANQSPQSTELIKEQGQIKQKTQDLEAQIATAAPTATTVTEQLQHAQAMQGDAQTELQNKRPNTAIPLEEKAIEALREALEQLTQQPDKSQQEQQQNNQNQQQESPKQNPDQQKQKSDESEENSKNDQQESEQADKQKSEKPETPNQESNPAEATPEDVPISDEDAEAIINQEQDDREQRQPQRSRRYRPTNDRDW